LVTVGGIVAVPRRAFKRGVQTGVDGIASDLRYVPGRQILAALPGVGRGLCCPWCAVAVMMAMNV
jgi:hypothetical protein